MPRPLPFICALASLASCTLRVHNQVGPGAACSASEQCPAPASPCLLAMCQDGACVQIPAPPGALPTEMQLVGNCKQLVCDGNGRVTAVGLMSNAPRNANPCIQATCRPDGPHLDPRKAGSPCGDGTVCTGTGLCAACVPASSRCEGAAVARCNGLGQWTPPAACSGAKPLCSMVGSSVAPPALAGEARCVGVVEIGVGAAHACARFEGGSVRCWGAAEDGQLGSAGLAQARRPFFASGYGAVALGHWHGCGVRGGSVECWGANDFGQLGDGTFASEPGPVQTGLGGVVEVAVGENHSCARKQDGTVSCWGRNDQGQLGGGKHPAALLEPAREPTRGPMRPRPTPMSGLDDAQHLFAGADFTCIRRSGGESLCFGASAGALPPPIDEPSHKSGAEADRFKARAAATSRVPVAVKGLSDAAQIACGGDQSCVRKNDGTVWCWGAGYQAADAGAAPAAKTNGARGPKKPAKEAADRFAPVPVEGVLGASFIALGRDFGCAIVAGGAVFCWGADDKGQLGRQLGRTAGPRGAAAPVAGMSEAVQIGAGDAFACALTRSGTVACWGDGANGQLGQGPQVTSAPFPGPVAW